MSCSLVTKKVRVLIVCKLLQLVIFILCICTSCSNLDLEDDYEVIKFLRANKFEYVDYNANLSSFIIFHETYTEYHIYVDAKPVSNESYDQFKVGGIDELGREILIDGASGDWYLENGSLACLYKGEWYIYRPFEPNESNLGRSSLNAHLKESKSSESVVHQDIQHSPSSEGGFSFENESAGMGDNKGIRSQVALVNIDSLRFVYKLVQEKYGLGLSGYKEKYEEEIKKKQQNAEEIYFNFERQAATMSIDELNDAQYELKGLQADIASYSEKTKDLLELKETELDKRFLIITRDFLSQYNEKAQYNYILAHEFGGSILITNEVHDITSEVISGLEEYYSNKLEKLMSVMKSDIIDLSDEVAVKEYLKNCGTMRYSENLMYDNSQLNQGVKGYITFYEESTWIAVHINGKVITEKKYGAVSPSLEMTSAGLKLDIPGVSGEWCVNNKGEVIAYYEDQLMTFKAQR